jgi:heptosyltransferase-2
MENRLSRLGMRSLGIKECCKVIARSVLGRLISPRVVLFFGEPFFWLLGRRGKERHTEFPRHKRVLVVRLDEIGDAVMTTPFLRELRHNLPEASITLVVKPSIRNLVELCPYVNEVLTYDRGDSRYWGPLQGSWRALRLAYQHLWTRHFDLVVVPRWEIELHHHSLVAYLSGAPGRVGYSQDRVEHGGRFSRRFDPLFTHLLTDHTLKHEVERGLEVIRFLGGVTRDDRLELWVGEEDEFFAEEFLRSHGARFDDTLIAVGPGAGIQRRMWPIANFVELGAWLRRSYQGRLVVLGGMGEESLGEELQRQLGDMVVNAVGRATLRQTAALLKRCRLYVGNDAGPMHLAAAAGVPVIEISCHPPDGSPLHVNSPGRFGPWRVPHVVLRPETARDACSEGCTSHEAHCILAITVEQVIEAVAKEVSRQTCTVLRR